MQKRSLRWSEGVCVLEGPDLVAAALEAHAEFEAIYVGAACDREELRALNERATDHGVRVFTLATGVLEKVSDAQTPQPVMAIARLPVTELETFTRQGLYFVVHELRDPGNAGTIIRSSDAAGVAGVVFTGQSVDPFNPKALRASAGSAFHVPVAVASLEATIEHFMNRRVRTIATVVRGGADLRSFDFRTPSAVFIGNEATGLGGDVVALCETKLTIAMAGRSESLNAAIAASLIAFEAMYQGQDATTGPLPRSLEGS